MMFFGLPSKRYCKEQQHFATTKALIDTELGRSKEEFIVHFKATYTNPIPGMDDR